VREVRLEGDGEDALDICNEVEWFLVNRFELSDGNVLALVTALLEIPRAHMAEEHLCEDFYDEITPRLHRRIGHELRLARYVLDLGCGSCELVQYLANAYDQKVTGVDISSDSFPHRRRRTRQGGRFHCIRRDASDLNFAADGSVDAVAIVWALHEMEKPEAILAEACRVLRPGGEVLVVDFPRESLAQQLWDEDYYRPDEVKSLLREVGFVDVRVRLVEREQVIWARGYRSMLHRARESALASDKADEAHDPVL